MENTVKRFSEFINEEINYTMYDNSICRLEDRWFFYDADDDIIYGSDEQPINDESIFSFNPKECKIVFDGKEKEYDINNPICLITYDLDKQEVVVYTENTLEYLQTLGFSGDDITTPNNRNKILDIFENNEDMRYILLLGDQLIASTFDVIEEN